MSINIKDYDYLEDGKICCAECDTQSIDIVIEAPNVRIGLCEHCFKSFIADANKLLADLDRKCRNCVHYRKRPDHYNYGGECHLHQVDGKYPTTMPCDCCGNFRFGCYEHAY